MFNIDNIILISSIFENRAIRKISEYLPPIIRELSEFINKNITKDEYEQWFNINANTFGKYQRFFKTDSLARCDAAFKYGTRYINIWTDEFYNNNNNVIQILICNIKKVPHNFNILTSGFLQKYGPIPNLFIFAGYSNFRILEDVPETTPKLAHEGWLIDTLSDLFRMPVSAKFLEEVEKFIDNNRKKIDNIRKYFSRNPYILGQGVDGVALSISDMPGLNQHEDNRDKPGGLVLKLFQDRGAYNQAKKAVERLHKYPDLAKTEAMIYDVGTLGKFGDITVYYTIMEKMIAARTLHVDAQYMLGSLVDKIFVKVVGDSKKWEKVRDLLKEPTTHLEIKKEVIRSAKKLEEYFKNPNNEDASIGSINYIDWHLSDKLNKSWLLSLIEDIIWKVITQRFDLHTGNIGITGYGEFRFFDPAIGYNY